MSEYTFIRRDGLAVCRLLSFGPGNPYLMHEYIVPNRAELAGVADTGNVKLTFERGK